MNRLTERTKYGIVGNNDRVSNYPLYKVANSDPLDHHITEQCFNKLAEYEDLEDRLNGISIKQVVDGFVKTVENQTCEGYEHGRILTNEEADKWNEYKQLEEQGLLLRLPCKEGTNVYKIINQRDNFDDRPYKIVTTVQFDVSMIKEIGKTIFLTKEQANQKLDEVK